jgi:phosphopantothenoylcysteine decarboxylase/phosphopantothenate--cysteine ligase
MVLAPAMNERMWNNPAVRRNVETIKEMGVEFIGPARGRLACGGEGEGRMSEPGEILEAIEKIALKIRHGKK